MPSLARYRSFIVVGSLYLLLVQLGFVVLALPGSLSGQADFGSFYAAGRLVRDGRGAQLYDNALMLATERRYVNASGPILPFIHPSYEAGLFALFGFFPYRVAFGLFFGANVVLLALSFQLLSPVSPWIRDSWKLLPVIALIAFLPVGACLIQDQDSILLLAIVAASYALHSRGRHLYSGLVLGLGMFRFQMVLPIAFLLLFARAPEADRQTEKVQPESMWAFLAGFAVSTLGMIGACVLISGPSVFADYTHALLSISSGLETSAQKLAYSVWPETMPNLRGISYFLLAQRVGQFELQLLILVCSAGLVVWAALKRLPFELAVLVAVLVSYHGGLHDSVLMFVPMLRAAIYPGKTFYWCVASWFTLLAGATITTVLRIPDSVLALVYLVFLVALVKNADEARSDLIPSGVGVSR